MVLQMPDLKAKLESQGSFPSPNSPEQFDAITKNDAERYSKILRDAGGGAK